MKKVLLLVFVILAGCSNPNVYQAKPYQQDNGKYCFYLENGWNDTKAGIYCKQ